MATTPGEVGDLMQIAARFRRYDAAASIGPRSVVAEPTTLPNSAHRTPAERAPAREPSRAHERAPATLLLMTRERTLFQTVRAVSSDHELTTVASESDLGAQIASGRPGVAIIDAAAVATPIVDLTRSLASQFPDLVLIIAGNAQDQSTLTPRIADGTVHRFLHKPVSRERVQLFVESAWRRRQQELTQPAPVLVLPVGEQAAPRPRQAWRIVAAVGLSVTLLGGGAAAWVMRSSDSAAPATGVFRPAGSVDGDAGESASELDGLLAQAEAALAAGRIEEAERLSAAARELQPDHVRVSFLDAHIGKERERLLLNRAREAAASGEVEAAIGMLEGAEGARVSTVIAETRRELEQRKLDEQVAEFLRRAEQRGAAGALIEPAQDNAHFFIRSAQALAPDSPAVLAARRSLASLLLESTRISIASGDAAGAERWLDAAEESGADGASVAGLRVELQKARTAARAVGFARLVTSFNQRLEENRLREPAGSSAKYWLGRLIASDPTHPATKAARESYASRVLAEGTAALARNDLEAADAWLAESRSSGAPPPELASLEGAIAAGRQASSVVDASALQRVRYVEPRFPQAARKLEGGGWVDLEFTVATDGAVNDVTVTRAEPQGVFDSAAVNAVRKWRYRPMLRDDAPVEQRARVRIVFVLE